MDSNSNIILSLGEEETVSQLKISVFQEELDEINSKFPLGENQIDIKQTYFLKKDNAIEVGIFIRNGLKNKISLEAMPLVMQDNNGNILFSKKLNLKGYGVLPPYSARPYTLEFEIDSAFNFDEHGEYTIKFEDANNFDAYSSVLTEIENMPLELTFEEEKAIRDFAKALPTLKTEEFTISAYKIAYNDKDGLDSIVILRNGTSKSVNLDKLPISIVDENGLIIARKVFEDKKGQFIISPKKSKILKLEFNTFEISNERPDLSKCTVVYK